MPDDFQHGMADGYVTAPGRPNHVNREVFFKHADQTMRERAHVGSAAWVEAPTFLGEFAHGSFSDYATVEFESVIRPGSRLQRLSPAEVDD